MPNVTYHVVVPFVRGDDGMLTPGEAKEAPNSELARRRALAVSTAAGNVGAIAFSRTGDPDSGDFAEGVVLANFGEVDPDALGRSLPSCLIGSTTSKPYAISIRKARSQAST